MYQTADISKRRIFRLVKGVRHLLPNYLENYLVIIQVAAAIFVNSVEGGLKQTASTLEYLSRSHDRKTFVKVIKFLAETKLPAYWYQPLAKIAETYAADKDELVTRTHVFCQNYRCFDGLLDYPILMLGMETCGEAELVQAISLAVPSEYEGETPEETLQYRAVPFEREQRYFAIVTARLGSFAKMRAFIDYIESNGLSSALPYFLQLLAAYGEDGDDDVDVIMRRIQNTVQLATISDCTGRNWVHCIYTALEYHQGSKGEIHEILCLAKKLDLADIEYQDFAIAIELWRRFTYCIDVYECFRQNKPGALTWQMAGIRLSHCAVGIPAEKRQKYLDEVEYYLHLDASVAALKMLHQRHAALGLNLDQRIALAGIDPPPAMISCAIQMFGENIMELKDRQSIAIVCADRSMAVARLSDRELQLYRRVYRMMRKRITTRYVP